MAILLETDKDIFFPEVPLTGNALLGLLTKIQAYGESPVYGAARGLEIQERTDVVPLDLTTQSGILPYYPVTDLVLVTARFGAFESDYTHDLFSGESDYGEVPVEAYILRQMPDGTAQISLKSYDTSSFGVSIGLATELRVTYRAGYDFQTVDPAYPYARDVSAIKSILGSLATAVYVAGVNSVPVSNSTTGSTGGTTTTSGGAGTGVSIAGLTTGGTVKRIRADDQYEVEFFEDVATSSQQSQQSALTSRGTYGENLSSLIATELAPLKKYFPKAAAQIGFL